MGLGFRSRIWSLGRLGCLGTRDDWSREISSREISSREISSREFSSREFSSRVVFVGFVDRISCSARVYLRVLRVEIGVGRLMGHSGTWEM